MTWAQNTWEEREWRKKKEEKNQRVHRDALKESLSGFDSSLDCCPRSLGW